MKPELLNFLRCPACKSKLSLIIRSSEGKEIKEGLLECFCQKKYKIYNFIPRFVDSDDYLKSFSFEWKIHRKTQLDSANEENLMRNTSESTFQKQVTFPLAELKDKLVLDMGCGMGRYAEIASKFGANVIGIDSSFAIDAAFENIGKRLNVHLIQADIFNLPFASKAFDFIFSFGVLHHTPDCENAFKQLPPLLKKGGNISIFVYSRYNKAIVYTSAFWRFFTTKLPKRLLYLLCHISVPLYFLYKIPFIGSIGKMLFVIPMIPHWKWRVLDTFDWYSPKYQSKHTHAEVFRWFKNAGLSDISIFEHEVTMMGTKRQLDETRVREG